MIWDKCTLKLSITMCLTSGAGVQWDNFSRGVSPDDNFTMLQVMVMLLIDGILYALIAWYVEGVYPGEYGIPQPWYFPCLVSD